MSDQATSQTPTYDALSNKQRQWVDLYLTCGMVQTEASRRMGYKAPENHGWRMWKNVDVKRAVRERLDVLAMKADEVLYRLSEQGRGSLRPFVRVSSDGFVYFNFGDDQALSYLHLVKKIKTKRKRLVEGHGDDAQEWEHEWMEVELYDAQGALKELAKIRGLTGPKGTEEDPFHHTHNLGWTDD